MRGKTGLAALLWLVWLMSCVPLGAQAQTAPQTAAEPLTVQWQLEVVRDGKPIDTFSGTTAVGQAVTATHHHDTLHDVGCQNRPAARIDLARTLTISPISTDTSGIMFAIDAQETIEDEGQQRTPDGCTLPPQPRRVSANHPGLIVPPGQRASWTIVEGHPMLVYRVQASLVSH
ncbi:phage head-binding domain-containing protein [Trinickia sp. LjRoot230]|uniref:hypothetical protein n=1 Tax=Trinickia sp. LjRoot230 TaxID=3342288 RepID=UPI003ED0EFFE